MITGATPGDSFPQLLQGEARAVLCGCGRRPALRTSLPIGLITGFMWSRSAKNPLVPDNPAAGHQVSQLVDKDILLTVGQ